MKIAGQLGSASLKPGLNKTGACARPRKIHCRLQQGFVGLQREEPNIQCFPNATVGGQEVTSSEDNHYVRCCNIRKETQS